MTFACHLDRGEGVNTSRVVIGHGGSNGCSDSKKLPFLSQCLLDIVVIGFNFNRVYLSQFERSENI